MDKKSALQLIRNRTKKTMVSALGIEITDFGEQYICGKMPVDHRTKQPFGLLHGGASVAFAETLGSIAAGNQVDLEKYSVVGIEINASHLRAVTDGWVHGKATPTRIGRKIQVWDIDIKDDNDKPVCKSRLTLAVIKKDDQ
ncbi:MAG: hotdog fold thioesterase [Candidatus Marinimicrobia bacterium]|jgi:1,4-dihydroxy-2-naphthoyl-CoA hydrolase|nr:hotdog fold thioesterase [Candidatus Neomarinimicrobiota bacterium]